MRFEKEMHETVYYIEPQRGIIFCNVFILWLAMSQQWRICRYLKLLIIKKYISDGIFVLNIGGYIGDFVRQEIEYVQLRGKEIVYHCN